MKQEKLCLKTKTQLQPTVNKAQSTLRPRALNHWQQQNHEQITRTFTGESERVSESWPATKNDVTVAWKNVRVGAQTKLIVGC